MKDGDYITILSPMVSKLKLSGNNLIVFALIHGFTKDDEHKFTGSIDYISKWTNLSKQSVILTLKALTEAGFLDKEEVMINGVKFCSYTTFYRDLISGKKNILPVKKVKKGSQKSLPEGSQKTLPNNTNIDNNINNKEISTNVDTKKEKTPYDKFNDWLAENAPNVCKLSKQMTEEQFSTIRGKYSFEQISHILLQMENYKGIQKKYTSVYLTFNNWAKREYGK